MRILMIMFMAIIRGGLVWLIFVGLVWLLQELINWIFSININENIWLFGAIFGLLWFWRFGEDGSIMKAIKNTFKKK